MNEINFNIEDIETINLLMDVGVKEIHPQLQEKELTINENGTHNIKPDEGYDALSQVSVTVDAIEDLTNELETYNNELTTQETTVEDIVKALKNKSGEAMKEYAPRYIKFREYKGSDLDAEIENLDTSNITDMYQMFYGCSKLVKLKLTNFNTSKVEDMRTMFYGNTKLTYLDLSSFDTSSLSDYGSAQIFYNCSSLTTLVIDNPSVFKITSTNAFTNSGIETGICTIYVPDDMVATYKADTYWGTYSNQIKGMSEYVEEV